MGTAIMPGWGTALGAVAGYFMGGSSGPSVASPAAGGGAAATPQAAQAAVFGSGIDSSGWQVNFGSGTQSLDNTQDKNIRNAGPVADALAAVTPKAAAYDPYANGSPGSASGLFGEVGAAFDGVNPLLWVALAGAVVWRLSKSSK